MFEFAWPWIFSLLPLPWLMRAVLPPAPSEEAALRVPFLQELAELSGRVPRGYLPAWRRQAPFLLIWLLLLSAAARPQWQGEPLPVPSSGRDLLLAVDVSGSMDYPDMHWQGQSLSRLALLQQLFAPFIESRQGDRLGLILFGSRAYLQAPLTYDRRSISHWLSEAQVGIAGSETALGDAIGVAIKRLRLRPQNSRVLLLITDGASNAGSLDPLVAARLAAAEQVRIYTLGIGAQAPANGPGLLAGAGALELDEPTLRDIAELTGGEYFRARDSKDLERIGEQLNRLEPVAQQASLTRLNQPLYPWPLALALLGSVLLCLPQLSMRWPHGRRSA